MRDPRTRARTRSEPTTAPLTWDSVIASLILALAIPVGLLAISYPATAAALATGAALPGLARRAVE